MSIRAGLELALAEVNQKGVLGGQKIVLTVEDSAGNKDQAINAARELIGRTKVVTLIGPTLVQRDVRGRAGCQRAEDPDRRHIDHRQRHHRYRAVRVPHVAAGIGRGAGDDEEGAVSRGMKSIALIYVNDDAFSKSGFDVMKAAADKAGVKIVATESFAGKDTDYSAQLTKIKGLKPDAIGISALVEPVSGVLLQARQLGFGRETQMIGGNGANSPKLGQLAGAAADGLLVGSPWFVGKPDPVNQKFVTAYKCEEWRRSGPVRGAGL